MKPRIIVLTGIDGAGKTTQAQLLVKHLQEEGMEARLVKQFASRLLTRNSAGALVALLKKSERSASSKSYFNEKGAKQGSHFRYLLGLFAVLRVAFMGFSRTTSKIWLNRQSSVIVFDRYFYDDLMKARWMFNVPHQLLENMSSFVPVPTLLFYLDISAETAWQRETHGDTTLEQHYRKKEVYDRWFEMAQRSNRDFHRISTDRGVDETFSEILDILRRGSMSIS